MAGKEEEEKKSGGGSFVPATKAASHASNYQTLLGYMDPQKHKKPKVGGVQEPSPTKKKTPEKKKKSDNPYDYMEFLTPPPEEPKQLTPPLKQKKPSFLTHDNEESLALEQSKKSQNQSHQPGSSSTPSMIDSQPVPSNAVDWDNSKYKTLAIPEPFKCQPPMSPTPPPAAKKPTFLRSELESTNSGTAAPIMVDSQPPPSNAVSWSDPKYKTLAQVPSCFESKDQDPSDQMEKKKQPERASLVELKRMTAATAAVGKTKKRSTRTEK